MKRILHRMRNRYLFIFDVLCCACAYAVAVRMILPANMFLTFFSNSFLAMSISAILYAVIMTVVGVYTTDWVYAGANDYMRLMAGVVAS